MSVNNNVIFKDFNLTPRAKKAYTDAYSVSKELGHKNITNLHVLYGCLKNASTEITNFLMINGFMINHHEALDIIKESAEKDSKHFFVNKNSDPWNKEVVYTIGEANKISHKLDQHYIGVEHIILALLNTSVHVSECISDNILEYESFVEKLAIFVNGDFDLSEEDNSYFGMEDLVDEVQVLETYNEQEEETPDFVTHLNSVYMEGGLPDVYGRDDEVSLLIETISKKNKSNAILTGNAGVGKTAIVEALVAKICKAEIPSNMFGMEILSVNIGSMLAGTQYRGQFEQKFKSLLQMAKKSTNTVLFFDEIHTIFGAGGNQEGSIDAANMMKPYLARGEIKCIGATTTEEYNKIFKKDSAMKRRFFEVKVEEPTKDETKQILYKCKSKYEEFHNVIFTKSIIDCVVDFSSSLISNKKFPDKAFDIIDQVGSRVKIKNSKPCKDIMDKHDDLIKCLTEKEISETLIKEKLNYFLNDLDDVRNNKDVKPIKIKKEDIIDVIAEHAKISADQVKSGSQNFTSFSSRIKKEVFGQDKAIDTITDLLSCAKAGLTEENKPLASMFFVGPTSVGKTYTAKKIAKNFFGNEKAILQINMSELYDKTGISKLIGSNSGYVGYEEGGLLTNFVKDNPNCVVLFDEVEKADPQILNILLHLLDEGYVEDNKHEKVDFSKSIVILTSNIGHKEVKKRSMGFVQNDESEEDSYKNSVKKELKPELLARINDVLVFDELCDSDMKRIIKHEVDKVKNKLHDRGLEINVKASSINCIFQDITNKKMHARDIKRYIYDKIHIPLAKIVISNSKKSQITIKDVDNQIKIV